MKKHFLIISMMIIISQNMLLATEYLPFILKAIKSNLKLPIKISYGKIYKVETKNNKTLILYIKTNTTVKFQKNKICSLPLFKDIINENGEIKYILIGKTKGTYIFNKKTCNN